MQNNNALRVILEAAIKSAYKQGNKDGRDGIFIDPTVYLEQFLLESDNDTSQRVEATLKKLRGA